MLFVLCLSRVSQAASGNLVQQPVDEEQLQVLRGNVHPLASQKYESGAAPSDLPMEHMLLVLKRSSEQQHALDSLMDRLHDPKSSVFHQWLTPEQVGEQFGASEQDIGIVTIWLQSHGLQVLRTSKGRTVIEFSGTAGQVQEAFHTAIRKFAVAGSEHWANADNPQIPAALTPVVAGVATIHSFGKKPQIKAMISRVEAVVGQSSSTPEFTASNGLHALSPGDYSTIYNIYPLYERSISGVGVSIAVVGRTNIKISDVASFRSIFGLSNLSPQIVVNGPDPGDLGGEEEAEAVLDTSWAGAVAQESTIKLVISKSTNATDGVDLSEEYIIDNNLADVMTESFGDCEANYTQAQSVFYSNLAAQAALQGITYTVASGDSGAAGCDSPDQQTATHPVSVNLLASNPYVVAVGGTQLSEDNSRPYWNSTNYNGTSVYSSIPEVVWNESCSTAQCGSFNAGLWAGGGGASSYYAKPSWQTGISGIPADGVRDVPDVALTAAGHDPYLLCLNDSCTADTLGRIRLAGYAGTSAATPAFAGLMALVVQHTGSRQGQANYIMYQIAAGQDMAKCNASGPTNLESSVYCAFNDVTMGNNAVPGQANYGTVNALYQAGVGYDLATGLGSVNAYTLVNGWSRAISTPNSYPGLSLSAASVDFGRTKPGQTMMQTVTLTNTGGAPLTFSDSLAGAQSSFTWTSGCPVTLAAGASCSLQITFAPITAGSFSASLPIHEVPYPYVYTIELRGVADTTSVLAVTPAVYNFGAQRLLGRSAVQTFQISNPTSQSISLSRISVVGNNAADFTVASNCETRLAAGDACSMYVLFSPQMLGARYASVLVNDNDQGGEQIIPLTGTGVLTGAFEIINAISGKALEPGGGSDANGVAIRQNKLNGLAQQQWRLAPTSEGDYVIVNVLTGKALEVTNFSSANGTPMQQRDCSGLNNQRWQLTMADDVHYRIVSRYNGKALEIPAASVADQTALQQWDVNGSGQQLWTFVPSQSYEIINSNSKLALTLLNGAADSGTVLQQSSLTGMKMQQWQFMPTGGGYYAILNRLTGKVLDVTGNSWANGAAIQEYEYIGSANQQWQLLMVDAAHYQIQSRSSGKVLDVTGSSIASGATVQQWDYLGGSNQQWQLTPVILYNVVNRHSGQALDVPNGDPGSGMGIQQWSLNGNQQQWWQLVPTGNGYYAILNDLTDKVLDITGASYANGALIQQYDYLSSANQQWQLASTDSGYYEIVSRQSGKVLDVIGASTAPSAHVQQFDYLGFENQQWSLRTQKESARVFY